MCYLRSDHDEILPNFPFAWNSKKWRVWLYFSLDKKMIFAGRQYPFSTDVGINFVKDTVLHTSKLLEEPFKYGNWSDMYLNKFPLTKDSDFNVGRILYNRYYHVGYSMMRLEDFVINHSQLHFNDITHSSCYEPMYATLLDPSVATFDWASQDYLNAYGIIDCGEETVFHIGSEVTCLKCGKHFIEAENESMMCDDCKEEFEEDFNSYHCDCCGCAISSLEYAHIVKEEILCENCYINEVETCACCNEECFIDNLTYDRNTNSYICDCCWQEVKNGG
jgi:hypothetical protein